MSSAQTDEGGASEAPNVEPAQMKHHAADRGRAIGPAADRAGYGSFASFSAPNDNGWLLQEVRARGNPDAERQSQGGKSWTSQP